MPIIKNYSVFFNLTDIVYDHNSDQYSSNIKVTVKGQLSNLITYEVLHFLYAFEDLIVALSKTLNNLATAHLDIVQAIQSLKNLQIDFCIFSAIQALEYKQKIKKYNCKLDKFNPNDDLQL